MNAGFTDYQIQQFKNGDQIIFEKLFDHYYPKIEFFCWRITNNQQEAQDISLSVLYKLWAGRKKFDSQNYVYHFLYTTARNACIDYLRKQKLQRDWLKEMIKLPTEQQEKSQELGAELMEILREELDQLPDRPREVFKLSFFDGLNIQEIAGQLGISENSVSVNKHKAIQLLKTALFNRNEFLLALIVSLACNLPN
ncbi:RNA polymerase sigma factor [Longitalea luteola]|uniref:RNA polymerase sigma factor n=1 Tax=Longitalea luteola TaxID=2812563 RepID=UPI001A95EB78|nr:RNA polymerase sigma-70 factor [Longitalea luteola]